MRSGSIGTAARQIGEEIGALRLIAQGREARLMFVPGTTASGSAR
jgi:hypothetical protein